MQTPILDVLYICDDRFAAVTGTSLTSLFEQHPPERLTLRVYLFLVEVSEENCARFLALGRQYGHEVVLIDAMELLRKVEEYKIPTYRGSAMTNLRLYFDILIPAEVHRLLYIDSDTLIVGPLDELAGCDLGGRMLGMVLDAYGDLMRTAEHTDTTYYNAGVILIDCDEWRRGGWETQINNYLTTHEAQFAHPDQDIYNIVCADEITRLPLRYNLQTVHREVSDTLYFRHLDSGDYYSEQEVAAARQHPAILHMVRVWGTNPWNTDGAIHPDYALFHACKERGPWRDCPPLENHPDLLIRGERLLAHLLPPSLLFPLSLLVIRLVQRSERKNDY